jgi:hypothetical protein
MEDFVGTPERLAALRGYCLTRDRHRCVITRAFDRQQLKERRKRPPANDDDGNQLTSTDNYNILEVVHIVPFALTKEDGSELVSPLPLPPFPLSSFPPKRFYSVYKS